MVVLVLFATTPNYYVTLATVIALTIAMFLNLKFIHPTRTKRWAEMNLSAAILWLICAAIAAFNNFEAGALVQTGLILSSLYLIFAGIAQQLFPQSPLVDTGRID
jgi:phosphatidylcholine synthase